MTEKSNRVFSKYRKSLCAFRLSQTGTFFGHDPDGFKIKCRESALRAQLRRGTNAARLRQRTVDDISDFVVLSGLGIDMAISVNVMFVCGGDCDLLERTHKAFFIPFLSQFCSTKKGQWVSPTQNKTDIAEKAMSVRCLNSDIVTIGVILYCRHNSEQFKIARFRVALSYFFSRQMTTLRSAPSPTE